MRRFVAATAPAIVFLCAASAATAEPRDAVERGQRMDTDAIRDDVRTNRLRVPEHPIAAEPSAQPAPGSKGKKKSKKSGESAR
jgi:hypothetical protein